MAYLIDPILVDCRRRFDLLKEITGEAATLDESQFCRKCSPQITRPQLVLTLRFSDGMNRTIAGVTADDLQLLEEFLKGNLTDRGKEPDVIPLNDCPPRLEKLLGVSHE